MISGLQNALELLNVKDISCISGNDLKNMFLKSYDIFKENFETINMINVFPVPDGDTGINMFETLGAIKKELINDGNSNYCSDIIRKIAYGAFNGSVGNSGIIFSEYIHGFEKAWENLEKITCIDFIRGLEKAAEMAYQSIDNPREGTILTVQKTIANYAKGLEGTCDNPYMILLGSFIKAKQALLKTHFILTEINNAKTIDAGALGFVFILEGFISAVFDEEVFTISASRTIDNEIKPLLDVNFDDLVLIEQEWEVQFDITTIKKSVELIKNQLRKEGECLIITYDHDCPDFKIHIHIKKPIKEFLSKLEHLFGKISNIRIMDLKSQNEEVIDSFSHKRET